MSGISGVDTGREAPGALYLSVLDPGKRRLSWRPAHHETPQLPRGVTDGRKRQWERGQRA